MNDNTPFKTPLPYRKKPVTSDSEESTNSDGGSSTSGTGDNISLVVLYDELHRLVQYSMEEKEKLEDAFLSSAEETKLLWMQWKTSVQECQRLQSLLSVKIEEASELERNLTQARKMLDEEKRKRKRAESQVEDWESQMARVCKTLFRDNRNNLNTDEVRQQLASIHGRTSLGDPNQLSAIQEVNTTGSILSDLSYSRSEDDLDSSKCTRQFKALKKLRPSNEGPQEEPAVKKRRSSTNKTVEVGLLETVKATTTLFVSREGPITATSVIESVPHSENNNTATAANIPPPNLIFESWNRQEGTPNTEKPQTFNPALRRHVLVPKTVVMPDTCLGCDNKIRFGRSVLRCKECKSYCHPDCKNILPLPCVPVINTPHKKAMGTVSDYTPGTAPMVPSLVVQCINEIEQRGFEELGIYRVPGSEKDVKSLKEKLLYARVPVNLKDTDIHVICGCLKDFLRSLTEPLVTLSLWKDFIQSVKAQEQDILPTLYQAISELPQPNRDTLAYLILHLQKVAEAKDCKMPIENIAKIFGPTVVGYSSEDLNPKQIVDETRSMVKVMEYLLRISSDYWMSFINASSHTEVTSRLPHTPSTDSLLRNTTSRLFTPTLMANISRPKRKEKGRIFYTPPSCK